MTGHNERRALIAATVTLDGRPAKVTGAANSYATVRNDIGQQGEWAWATVARIVAQGGRFTL